ncbi:aldolase [Paenibacillus sp. sptzw28]|uniref:aldolase n=1 Tax=Paenibacillus sp. sptzw28 TaxID=715179 RepID=UPI001C6F4DCC|nr:aldolase [Paenibacillus sp. sptzw28]QYR20605.1 aldolase [Paenibacillus sp. sptzw28]
MIPTVKKMKYKAFGLQIVSEIVLPELMGPDLPENEPDVEIVVADLSKAWQDVPVYQKFYGTADGQIFLHVPETALFSIAEGSRITVSPMAGADENKIRLYLLGTCMGALLMQRRILPLHGSAVVINGKAYAFVGESGAGKSTLAAAFRNSGYQLLSDDVIAVSLSPDNPPDIIPSYPQQKLWENSITHLGMETNRYNPLYQEVNKYAVPVASTFCKEPVPFAGVFELVKAEGMEAEIHPVQSLERFPLLLNHTYRNLLIPLLEQEQWHFSASAHIAGNIDVYRLSRPAEGFTAYELVDRIIDTVIKGGRTSDQSKSREDVKVNS